MDLAAIRNRLACCSLSEEKYKDAVLSLLLAIADDSGSNTEHTMPTGTNIPVPAGAYSVIIINTGGTNLINGIIPLDNLGSQNFVANNNKTLPAITITGGTWIWSAII